MTDLDVRLLVVRGAPRVARAIAAVVFAVAAASLAVELLEGRLGVENASTVYLVAVAAIAILFGVPGAVLTAVASVLVYDYLFTQPRHTFVVASPGEWLNLVLLLFVAVTVGQLAALQRARADAASARERESRALFGVTRALAGRDTTLAALPEMADRLRGDARMDRVWFGLGADDAGERIVAASPPGTQPLTTPAYGVLHVGTDSSHPTWTLVRTMTGVGTRGAEARRAARFRVRMEVGGRAVGSLWAERDGSHQMPDAIATRLLQVTADLVGQALVHDRLAEETRRAAVAQQSDELKSALLESVSHDLRTPLASIRASAGTLMDPDVALADAEARASAVAIDREALRLNRLVSNLLDLSRIEGGALRVAEEALDMEDVVGRAVAQVRGDRRIEVDLAGREAVTADAVLLEEVLINLLDNAVKHTPGGTPIVVSCRRVEDAVVVSVEDGGPGVPDDALGRIFDRFVRGETTGGRRRAGTGLGLAVVRGFVDAMGGHVSARRSRLGGLAVDVELRAADLPQAAG